MKLPDRKVWAGGLAGILTWALMLGLGYAGYPVPLEMQPMLVSFMGTAIGYLTPPSQYDKIKRLNDALVVMAQDDPTINVTKPPGQTTAPPGATLGPAATAALNVEKRNQ